MKKMIASPPMQYRPTGWEFFDSRSGRDMMFVNDGEWKGWLAYRHPDGQWVSLRKVTKDDVEKLTKAIGDKIFQENFLRLPKRDN